MEANCSPYQLYPSANNNDNSLHAKKACQFELRERPCCQNYYSSHQLRKQCHQIRHIDAFPAELHVNRLDKVVAKYSSPNIQEINESLQGKKEF